MATTKKAATNETREASTPLQGAGRTLAYFIALATGSWLTGHGINTELAVETYTIIIGGLAAIGIAAGKAIRTASPDNFFGRYLLP